MQKLVKINEGLEAAKLELQARINNVEVYELIMKEVSISKKTLTVVLPLNVFLLKP